MFASLFAIRGKRQFQAEVPGETQNSKPWRRSFAMRSASKLASYHQSIKTVSGASRGIWSACL
jgi:hypothetical protein